MKKRKNELKRKGELAEEILVLDKLAKILRKNRIKNGAITFDRRK
jgi:ribonuclease R